MNLKWPFVPIPVSFCQDCSVSLHWSSKLLAYVKASFVYLYETGQMVHALLGFIYKVTNIMARFCCWNEDGCLFRDQNLPRKQKSWSVQFLRIFWCSDPCWEIPSGDTVGEDHVKWNKRDPMRRPLHFWKYIDHMEGHKAFLTVVLSPLGS